MIYSAISKIYKKLGKVLLGDRLNRYRFCLASA